MITAVDTSVLIDIFGADPVYGRSSRDALIEATASGSVIVCEVVWAETSAAFDSLTQAERGMAGLGVRFVGLDQAGAFRVGEAWRNYRRRGGTRDRVIADFLIGAHAVAMADRLLTRDRGFYRTYFDELEVVDPSR